VLTGGAPASDELRAQYAAIAADLGRTVPHLRLLDAVGYRIRRNYGYLFTLGLLAWFLKLEVHPVPAHSIAEYVHRAAVGFVPGPLVIAGVLVLVGLSTLLAVKAPSEGMLHWAEVASPLGRWLERSAARRRARRL
jgi:uncharacterized membrane protein